MAAPESRLPHNLVVVKPRDFRSVALFPRAFFEGKING
jgi:hypothetical protein